jgi:flagellin
MVSSVQPAAYAPVGGVANSNRPPSGTAPNDAHGVSDSVDVGQGGRAEIGAARGALAEAAGSLDLALAAGREAANIVAQIRDLARSAAAGDSGAAAEPQFRALLQRYGQVINGAIEGGAGVLAGASLTVPVDPEAPPVTVQGYDLQLKDQPGAEDVLRLSTASSVADSSSATVAARDADASLARIDTALSRLSGASQRLAAHDGFLRTLDGALARGIDPDLDTEGALLTALQVRQSLGGAGSAIANSAPGALLSLFRE